MSEEKVHLFWLFSRPTFFRICERQRGAAARRRAGAAERLRLKRGERRPQICPTVAGGLLTDCSPPFAMWPQWAGGGGGFNDPKPFPAPPKRKGQHRSGTNSGDPPPRGGPAWGRAAAGGGGPPLFPVHFLSLPHRKETCCRCLGKTAESGLHGRPSELRQEYEISERWGGCECARKFKSGCPHCFTQKPLVEHTV